MPTASGLFVEAGHLIVDLARRRYEQDDAIVLPRNVANFKAFENAMSDGHRHGRLDQHGAASVRRGVMKAKCRSPWRISTGCRAGCRCCARSRPGSPTCIIEDVHRAGGVMAILGEFDRAGLLHAGLPSVHVATLGERA